MFEPAGRGAARAADRRLRRVLPYGYAKLQRESGRMPGAMTARSAFVAVVGSALVLGGLHLALRPAAAAGGTSAAVAGLAPAAPLQGGSCQRALLSRKPGWSTSAAWTAANELVVIDQMDNRALRYSASGESLGTVPDAAEVSLERAFPVTVKASGSNVVFELSRNRLQTFDPAYALLADTYLSESRQEPSTAAARSQPAEIKALWLWQPVGSGSVVAFSDLALPPRHAGEHPDYRVGFVRFPIEQPWNFKVLGGALAYDSLGSSPCPSSCDAGTALRLYNRLGHEYIAALGDSAFILRMDELKIYRQAGDALEPLEVDLAAATQPGFSQPPALPRLYKRDDYTNVMAKVEISTMPTGLYAWGRWLFVTTRTFDGTSTRWTVTKIDPETRQIMGTATIPTTANHLTIAPGPERWAFIEKGPVKGWNDNQEIPSILFVPAAKFGTELKGDLCSE